MKKYLSLLCGGLIVLFMLATPGNPVKAAEECGCNVTPIVGHERNVIVSNLLKSDEFKDLKKDLKKEGYKWNGAHDIEVVKNNDYGIILVGVPFTDDDGIEEVFVFIDGVFVGSSPR
jgi:hypothetical protein